MIFIFIVCIVTGDHTTDMYVKKSAIYHQRDVFNSVLDGPNKDHTRRDVTLSHDEVVQFISITPLVFQKNFTINFAVTAKKMTSKLDWYVVESFGE